MQNSYKVVAAVAALAAVSACTSGQSGFEPVSSPVNLNTNKLQFAIGVATFSGTGGAPVLGLNVVPTFRQPNGLSATLLNTPALTGPFTVPATAAAGTDAGTGHITGSPQVQPGVTAVASTFAQSGGIFASGLAPENSTTSGAASFALYASPLYASTAGLTATTYRGGPPAYPQVTTGTYPIGFAGFTEGFTSFIVPPVTGTYNLSVGIQDGSLNTTTISAPSVTLGNATGLAVSAPPTAVDSNTSGLTVSFTAPPGTTESLVNVVDTTAGTYFTVLTTGAGPQTAVVPPTLGIYAAGAPTATFTAGDKYSIRLVNVDYPAFESGVPQNSQQTPTLTGAAGQADISYAPVVGGTY